MKLISLLKRITRS